MRQICIWKQILYNLSDPVPCEWLVKCKDPFVGHSYVDGSSDMNSGVVEDVDHINWHQYSALENFKGHQTMRTRGRRHGVEAVEKARRTRRDERSISVKQTEYLGPTEAE